jgi:hypothetical protein
LDNFIRHVRFVHFKPRRGSKCQRYWDSLIEEKHTRKRTEGTQDVGLIEQTDIVNDMPEPLAAQLVPELLRNRVERFSKYDREVGYPFWKKCISLSIQEKLRADLPLSFSLDALCVLGVYYAELLETQGTIKKLEKKEVYEVIPHVEYEFDTVSHEFLASKQELPKFLDNANVWNKMYIIEGITIFIVVKRTLEN